jgi:hypothetical protein
MIIGFENHKMQELLPIPNSGWLRLTNFQVLLPVSTRSENGILLMTQLAISN